jgi:hypothetical protein
VGEDEEFVAAGLEISNTYRFAGLDHTHTINVYGCFCVEFRGNFELDCHDLNSLGRDLVLV